MSVELATLNERLAEFDAAAAAAAEARVIPNTRLAFEQDWNTWVTFCDTAAGVPPESVSPGLLAAFAGWLAQGGKDRPPAAPATIARRLTGVLHGWRACGCEVPRGITAQARELLTDYQRELDRTATRAGRGKAPALLVAQLRRMCAELPEDNAGIRDRALLTLGFGVAARRSELAHLLVEDVTVEPVGLEVVIRASKAGNRSATGTRTVVVKAGVHEPTDPHRAWLTWLTRHGLTAGPAFRRVTRHDAVLAAGLSPAAIGDIVTRRAAAAGVYGVTGHSLRSGLATEARRAGHTPEQIARQGGWTDNSRVLYGYMQTVDRWTDNVTEGLL